MTSTRNPAEVRPIEPRGERRISPSDQHPDRDRDEHDGEDLEHLSELHRDAALGAHEVREREVHDEREGDERDRAVDGGERDVEGDVTVREVAEEVGRRAPWRGRE
jgi:hypothetical protein